MEISHIFVLARLGDAETLAHAGLVESYRRTHAGQGTSNVCYCFDNAFIELLFVDDEVALARDGPTGLSDRARLRSAASPFGIAIRSETELPFPTWSYRPSYLPEGAEVLVDQGAQEIGQPFIFRPPNDQRPDQWTGPREADCQWPSRNRVG